MSVTFGVSFTNTGFVATFLTAEVTSAASFGDVPKPIPPPCTFGQLMFTSRIPTFSAASSFSAHATYSATENPPILAITGLP